MADPSQYRFSESHEWFHADGELVTLGITPYAADELTDITYVEMKPVGTKIGPGEAVGEVESVKTTSEVYTAVGGEIAEVNQKVVDDPSLVNGDALGDGWLVKIRADDIAPLRSLMTQQAYDEKHPVG